MSSAEPVSAFGAFRTAKEMAEAKKKSKKSAKQENKAQSGTGKTKQTGNVKEAVKKEATNKKKENNSMQKKSKAENVSTSKPKATVQPNKVNVAATKNQGNKNKSQKFKDSEVIGLVEHLMGDPSKKLSKSQIKKKQELEDYLVEQLEKDERSDSQEGEDDEFNSGSEEQDDEYTDSNEYSDEYTINESGSYSDEEASVDEIEDVHGSSETESTFSEAEVMPPANINNNKRKGTEPSTTAKSNEISAPKANGVSEAKKAKTANERKSLPANKAENKATADDNKRRKSLDQGKAGTARKVSITTASVKLEPLSPPHNITKISSIEEGKRAFQWLINPIKVEDFFSMYWESKACLIKRQQSSYFSHLISFEGIDQMLLKNHVEFTKNIDVTSYKNGVRETLNPEGRALPPVVWDHYGQGCSIRLLNPQTFLPNLYTVSATMQEYFHCLVGANAYLTPPNSQGFAPHYDDIEAFVLQIEGRKRWKLYTPRNTGDVLPRISSKNFDQKEIGKPILEEVLEPGDVLYFPRGTIHQACTEPGYHSLHITLSVYQKQSFADLFEKMMPLILQKAIASQVELRRGLPLHIWQHAGIAFSDISSKERSDLQQKVTKLMQKFIKEMPLMDIVDTAVDQCAKKFQHEALPPEILSAEKLRTMFGSRNRTNERGECICDYDINERTNVRLLRANILRLVEEEEKIRIYYYLDNSKEYCEYEPNFIEIEATEAASIEVLIKSYPSYVGVSQLPLSSDEQKITLVTALWERGLLMTEKPFK